MASHRSANRRKSLAGRDVRVRELARRQDEFARQGVKQIPTNTSLEFLTVSETAALLRVTARTIRTWIQIGRLDVHRAGRRVLVAREDIERLLDR